MKNRERCLTSLEVLAGRCSVGTWEAMAHSSQVGTVSAQEPGVAFGRSCEEGREEGGSSPSPRAVANGTSGLTDNTK